MNSPHILAHFRDLQARGLPIGYFPELTKSILVVAQMNVSREKYFFRGMGLKVLTGSRYMGGYIGEGES